MIGNFVVLALVWLGSLQLLADGWNPLPVVLDAAALTVLIGVRWARAR